MRTPGPSTNIHHAGWSFFLLGKWRVLFGALHLHVRIAGRVSTILEDTQSSPPASGSEVGNDIPSGFVREASLLGYLAKDAPPTHTYSGPSASFSTNLNSKHEDACGCRRVCKPASQAITQLWNNLHLALSLDLASAHICPLNMESRAVGWTVSYVNNRKHGANLRRILLFTCISMLGHCNWIERAVMPCRNTIT